MSGKITFTDMARLRPESAECATIAIFRRLASVRARRITLTLEELMEAEQFQLIGESAPDGKSMAFTLERKVVVL